MDGAMNYNMTNEYKINFKKGLEYQKFIKKIFKKKYNFELNFYENIYDQYYKGETKEGFEIKFDDLLKKYNNLYIEIGEKTNKKNKEYKPSGIFRKDNTKWYVIGNYNEIWIFKKYILLNYFINLNFNKKIEIIKTTETSKGFILNLQNRTKLKQKLIKL